MMLSWIFHITFSLIIILSESQSHTNFRRTTNGYSPNFTYPYTSQVKVTAIVHLIHETKVTNCTGSAITDIVVLTAAHCLYEVDEVDVGYGSFKASELKFIRAINWTFHPDYHSHIVRSIDMALIFLEDSIKFTNEVRPVHPRYFLDNTESEVPSDPQYTALCGFGLDQDQHSDVLHDLKCINSYKYDQYCNDRNVDHEDIWCFYPEQTDNTWKQPCPGDEGAGMFFYYGDNVWKYFSIYFESRPKSGSCTSPNNTIMAVELSHKIVEWINSQVKLAHDNLCSIQVEIKPQ